VHRRRRIPRRAVRIHRNVLPAVSVAGRQPGALYGAGRRGHGRIPGHPDRHQRRNGPPGAEKPAAVEIKNSGNASRTVIPPSDASLPEGGTVIPDKPERCGQAAPQTAVSLPWLTRSSLPRVMDDPNLLHKEHLAPFIKKRNDLAFH